MRVESSSKDVVFRICCLRGIRRCRQSDRACCSLPSLSGAGLSCSTKQLQRRATGQRVQSCGQELADEETRHIQQWHDGLLRDMSPVLLVSFLMLKVMMHTFRLMGNP